MRTGIEENYCISLDPWTSKQRLNTTNWPSLDSRHSPTPWSLMIQCSPPLLDKMLGEPGVIKHSQCFKSSPGSTSGKWSMVPGYSPPIPSKGWRYTTLMATSLLCILWHSYASHLCRANSITYVNILLTGIHLRSRPAHTRPRKLLLTTIRVSCRFQATSHPNNCQSLKRARNSIATMQLWQGDTLSRQGWFP